MGRLTPKPVGICLTVLALLLGGTTSTLGGEVGTREYQLKAAFLYNFAKFVEWPGQTSADNGNGFVLCLLGKDPFGTALDTIEGKLVKGRPIQILAIAGGQSVSDCDMAFVGADDARRVSELLEPMQGLAILTIGEAENFTERGGMIRLLIESNKVRFDINNQAANDHGLRISSQLLKLAKHVIR